jgi:DNA-binding CsgD family transcriptional regulator
MARETIEDLKKQIADLKRQLQESYQREQAADERLNKLIEAEEERFRHTPLYKQMEREISVNKSAAGTYKHRMEQEESKNSKLREQLAASNGDTDEIKALQAENEALKKKNARGAGRKPSAQRKEAIRQLDIMLAAGKSETEIAEQLGISMRTLYRYKKELEVIRQLAAGKSDTEIITQLEISQKMLERYKKELKTGKWQKLINDII